MWVSALRGGARRVSAPAQPPRWGPRPTCNGFQLLVLRHGLLRNLDCRLLDLLRHVRLQDLRRDGTADGSGQHMRR